jgi:DNA-directed RNA polymerase subunit RPC12/RpoP
MACTLCEAEYDTTHPTLAWVCRPCRHRGYAP